MQAPGEPLTEGGIIGHANGEPGLVTFRVGGRQIPLTVHYLNGTVQPVSCWWCGDTRRYGGIRCPACRPTPPREMLGE